MADYEQRLRELAYRLWEEAGYPHGRSDEFWYTAIEILASETRPPELEATEALASDLAVTTELPPAAKPAPAEAKTDKLARKAAPKT